MLPGDLSLNDIEEEDHLVLMQERTKLVFKPTLDLENSHSASTQALASLPKTPTVEELKPKQKDLLITIKLKGMDFKAPREEGPFSSTSMSRSSEFDDENEC